MAWFLQSLPKLKKRKNENKRKCWKPVSCFPAMVFEAFFCMVVKNSSLLLKN